MKQWKLTEPYLNIKGGLLEGPYYDERTYEARFIDITKKVLYIFEPEKGRQSLEAVKTEDTISVTATIEGSDTELIVGAKYGFAKLNKSTGAVSYTCKIDSNDQEKQHRMRFNDGAVDSRGRFWAGSMTDPEVKIDIEPEGTLYRMDSDLSIRAMVHGVNTPNGLGWNSADTKMFWTDSELQTIYVFDFDAPSGNISNQRIFYKFDFGPGVNPDGLCIDEEDCIWTAVWKGGKVLRLSPKAVIIAEVHIPTPLVTCPVFVGTKLLITTCCDESVSTESVERGGDIYMVDVGVTGPSDVQVTHECMNVK